MKKYIKKFAAVFCSMLTISASSAMNVLAKAKDDSPLLPSGKTLNQFKQETINYENGIGFASAAVGIFQDDDVIYEKYFGKTDIENNIMADENSVYEWGSITKTLVWVSVLQLWEQGRIDLEKDVKEYLPEGFFQHLSYDEPITMLNLMNHNGGWQESTSPIFNTDENEISSLFEELQKIEPVQVFRPGETSAYSNYGAAVAGYVVECITGQDFCEYVHENIFEPLGMEHTALNPAHTDNDWVCEQRKKMKSYVNGLVQSELGSCLDYVTIYPAGAATGTLKDIITYAQALVNADSPLFENSETWEYMFTDTDFYGNTDIPKNAHGFWCTEYAVRTYGHSGGTTGYCTNMIFDLESKTGLVVLTNQQDENLFLTSAPNIVFGFLQPEKYASEQTDTVKLDGYYTPSRSLHSGILKFASTLSTTHLDSFDEIQNAGDGLYVMTIVDDSYEVYAELLGDKSGDKSKIEMPSVELKKDSFYILKISLLAGYVIAGFISLLMLMARHQFKKHKKFEAFSGSTAIKTGNMTGILSFILFLTTYGIFSSNNGITSMQSTVIGIMQIICAVICTAIFITSVVSLIKTKAKSHTLSYVLSILTNAFSVTAILFFEMYKFWF